MSIFFWGGLVIIFLKPCVQDTLGRRYGLPARFSASQHRPGRLKPSPDFTALRGSSAWHGTPEMVEMLESGSGPKKALMSDGDSMVRMRIE